MWLMGPLAFLYLLELPLGLLSVYCLKTAKSDATPYSALVRGATAIGADGDLDDAGKEALMELGLGQGAGAA